jgi:hypothetical protein
MKKLMLPVTFTFIIVGLFGCGTLLNGKQATLVVPEGTVVDGARQAGSVRVKKDADHHVVFADGRACTINSRLSIGYLAADVLLFPIGWIVDAVTGDWSKLDAASCPGVTMN